MVSVKSYDTSGRLFSFYRRPLLACGQPLRLPKILDVALLRLRYFVRLRERPQAKIERLRRLIFWVGKAGSCLVFLFLETVVPGPVQHGGLFAHRVPGPLPLPVQVVPAVRVWHTGRMADLTFDSRITCPGCKAHDTVTMPVDECVTDWACPACGHGLSASGDDCCVFCAFGTVECPPQQIPKYGGCCA